MKTEKEEKKEPPCFQQRLNLCTPPSGQVPIGPLGPIGVISLRISTFRGMEAEKGEERKEIER